VSMSSSMNVLSPRSRPAGIGSPLVVRASVLLSMLMRFCKAFLSFSSCSAAPSFTWSVSSESKRFPFAKASTVVLSCFFLEFQLFPHSGTQIAISLKLALESGHVWHDASSCGLHRGVSSHQPIPLTLLGKVRLLGNTFIDLRIDTRLPSLTVCPREGHPAAMHHFGFLSLEDPEAHQARSVDLFTPSLMEFGRSTTDIP
jgi:hypothetical protein